MPGEKKKRFLSIGLRELQCRRLLLAVSPRMLHRDSHAGSRAFCRMLDPSGRAAQHDPYDVTLNDRTGKAREELPRAANLF